MKTTKPATVEAEIATEASEVRVGDYLTELFTTDKRAAKVVAVTRLERGVTLVVREPGPDGAEASLDLREDAEVVIASRMRHPCGFLLYRVPHPTRPGLVAFVSIPEDQS